MSELPDGSCVCMQRHQVGTVPGWWYGRLQVGWDSGQVIEAKAATAAELLVLLECLWRESQAEKWRESREQGQV